MRIRWTVPAADDLANIKNYLELNYARHAETTCGRFIRVSVR